MGPLAIVGITEHSPRLNLQAYQGDRKGERLHSGFLGDPTILLKLTAVSAKGIIDKA